MNAMISERSGAGAGEASARFRSILTSALLLVITVFWGLPSAQAVETTVQNDSATDGSLTTACPCFIPGEQTAAWLTSPCDGNIVGIQVFWKSTFGGAPDSTEFSLGLFGAGTFPTPGAALANDVGGPAVISGPTLSDGIYNEYRFLTDGTTPISVPVTAGQTFVASLEYLNSNAGGSPLVPSTVFDHDGCQAGKNAAFAVPGGWADACLLGVTGDWVIRAIVDCPGPCDPQPFTGADACAGVNIHSLPVGPFGNPATVTISGDNTGATFDCSTFGTVWWEAFTITQGADVTVDFCCSVPPRSPVFTFLSTTCQPAVCTFDFGADIFDFSTCGDGNPTMTFLGLPAGTYYYPIFSDSAVTAVGPYQMHIGAERAVFQGSCCDTSTGTCTDDVIDTDCAGANDTFLLNGSCCESECSTTPGQFDSAGITLLSNLSFADFPGAPHLGNEVWGYVSPSGREYAIMGFSTGTGFVDITDPLNPVVVGFVDGFPIDQPWRDMAVFNQHAYIVTDGDGVGLQIVDLSDIDNGNVTLANTTDLGVGFVRAHNVFVNEDTGFLYLPLSNLDGGNGFRVLDLNIDPVNPPVVGTWMDTDPNVRCHDVQVVTYTGPDAAHVGKEIAFCFAENGGVRIVDVSNKAAMARLSFLIYPNTTYCHQGWMTDDSLYLLVGDELDERDDPDVSVTTTYVIDISDLDAPVLHTTFTNNACAIDHNLMVRGDRVYEANYSTGLRVFDISNINAVTEVAFFDTHPEDNAVNFNGLWGVFTDFPSGVIVASDRQRGLFVFREGNPPAVVGPKLPGIVDGVDHDIRKQRFLSVNPNNPLATTRMRLSLQDNTCNATGSLCANDAECRVCVGGTNVGGECDFPNQCPGGGSCEVSGESCDTNSSTVLGFILDPVQAGGDALPNTLIAAVGADPGFRVWDESLVHIVDCETAPGRVYLLEVEEVNSPGLFAGLTIRTAIKPPDKEWGDLVGNFTLLNGWSPPNGIVGVDDLSSILKHLTNKPAPHVTVVELLSANPPSFVNMDVNGSDLGTIIKAFQGKTYPDIPMLVGGYPDLHNGATLLDCTGN